MTPSIIYLSALILHHSAFQYLIILLGAAFGGELALFAIAFLAAQKILSLYSLIILTFLGTFSSDILWFLLGRTETAKKIISHRYASNTIAVVTEAIRRVSRGSKLLALIFAKFLVGTRIIMIMDVSKTDLVWKEFLRYDAIAVVVWLLVVIPIGFISGLGFTYLAQVFDNIYIGIGFILLIVFIVIIIQVWLEKIFVKKL